MRAWLLGVVLGAASCSAEKNERDVSARADAPRTAHPSDRSLTGASLNSASPQHQKKATSRMRLQQKALTAEELPAVLVGSELAYVNSPRGPEEFYLDWSYRWIAHHVIHYGTYEINGDMFCTA